MARKTRSATLQTGAVMLVRSGATPFVVVVSVGLFSIVALIFFLVVVLKPATSTAASCQSDTSPVATGVNVGDGSSAGIKEILRTSSSNNRLILTKLMGSRLESNWNPKAVGAGSFGLWQIQHPAGAPLSGTPVHPDITMSQALDPVFSTRYMDPAYRAGLRRVPASWWSNPSRAGEYAAYYSEKPALPYHVARGQSTVDAAYNASIKVMQQNGISTEFANGSGPAGATLSSTTSTQATSANCDSQTAQNPATAGDWQLPIAKGDYVLTAGFGQCSNLWAHCHTGQDFAAPTGTPIHAITGGVIISEGRAGPYGNRTIMRAPDGTELWYAHQSAYVKHQGDTVTAGTVIGLVGTTGNVTGPHVHVEVRPRGGSPVDPMPYLRNHGLHP